VKLNEIRDELSLEVLTGSPDTQITGCYTSDLLSDVMAHAEEGDVLVTIQAHNNTVAVASNVDAPAIIVCNARPIPDEMIAAATEHGITLCRTPLNQFEVSGRLYARLV
jgi:serine kinase of HPr protein (carbohydrate metabolism regulator)